MSEILPGLKAALNYHPIFVHFPIALWLAALLFEFLSTVSGNEDLHRTAMRLLYLGTLAGTVTVLSGLAAESSVPETGPARDTFEFHETMMLVTFSLSVGLCLFAFLARKNFTAKLRKLMLVGLAVLATLLTIGADRGGAMVFKYGVSVNWPAARQQVK